MKLAHGLAVAAAIVLFGWLGLRLYQVHSAVRAFEIADDAGRGFDACNAAAKVAAIHLERGNSAEYREWSNREMIICYNARSSASRGL